MSAEAHWLLWAVILALLTIVGLLWLVAYRLRPPAAPPPDETAPRTELPPAAPRAPSAPLVVLHRPGRTRYPIVLAHGYFGFESLGVTMVRQEYFRGIRRRLEALGHVVHVARVSPAAGIEVRALQLTRQIQALDAAKVNIIAHSMGGLDARYAIAHHGLGPRVASLTTIGTPHRGTPLADRLLWFGELRRVRNVLDMVGANVDGAFDLTTRRMVTFNTLVADSPEVVYTSVIGAVGTRAAGINALLLPGHTYLNRLVGSNDGIVPAESQRWGEILHEVEADHWAQIGWSRCFDAGTFYVRLVESLVARGF